VRLHHPFAFRCFSIAATAACLGAPAYARQATNQAPASASTAAAPVTAAVAVQPPADYLIGPDDVLNVVFWREKDMSADVTVRPDGKVSLPLLNDVQASGLTPEQLRLEITKAATKFVEDPTVTVVVKTINSRKVFITGQVGKPGPYQLSGPTTILQLIAMAGGVSEFADVKDISLVRTENGHTSSYRFNYEDVSKRKNLQQNLELKPNDTVIVP